MALTDTNLGTKFLGTIIRQLAAYIITFAFLALFILDVTKTISVDSIGIILLIVAVCPWILPKLSSSLDYISEKLGNTNIKSIAFGNIFRIEQLEHKVATQEKRLDEQRRMIDDLVLYSMSWYLYDILKDLYFKNKAQSGEWVYHKDSEHNLRYLRDHGYLQHFNIRPLQDGDNLVGKVKLTEMGERFVELHQGIIKREY